ncbi:elongator complex protein 5 [Diorhabda carinulata]|uniref:elongator complex protein 5 n=1 Tax=Diorhabda carinulata TaxID=1163345 RepID=UPI0025A0EE58|nr:elongator complex protein 5 [Diorhabda carinulata]
MLSNYLTSIPCTKFVLIEDTVHEKGKPIFDFLLKSHLERPNNRIHYFVFQEPFVRVKNRMENENLVLHDFVSNNLGWDQLPEMCFLEDMIKDVGVDDVIFIDSLAHTIYEYGLAETYRILNLLKNNAGVQQIIALLHQDLLEEKFKILQSFEHLSTLNLILQDRSGSSKKRIQYTYKKVGGKVIKETEEFWFEGEKLITKKIEKLDAKQILEKSVSSEINPEKLSTFKIGLSDADKKSRDELVLPYLPKHESEENQQSGNIFYKFDDVDDWDEEDPDDDLDI